MLNAEFGMSGLFKKVLIANRGEIATRVIRACKELGIATKVGVDAIHPGYGFLSENPRFPQLCEKKGITFIGPTSRTIADMGDKVMARNMMKKAEVPILPGTEESIKDVDEAIAFAEKIGYPIMVKASGGGGGRGLRVARNEKDLVEAITTARKESAAAFGVSEVFLEKYLDRPHHIEFQVFADNFGNTVHLGERDCSIQRRHQKLIEITPSLILNEDLRQRMGEAAVK